MASRHTLFRIFYQLGFTPWDGHAIPEKLRDLVEGTGDNSALPAASALDIGCGTGDSSIYLAQHGWKVTSVDFVAKALHKARAKARAASVPVKFVQADVTHLGQTGVHAKFGLMVDNGCLHGMSDDDRDLYVKEITAAAAPGARLVIIAAPPGGPVKFLGLDGAEVERRFTPTWTLLSSRGEKMAFANSSGYRYTPIAFIRNRFSVRCYVLQLTG
jgi:SAM-dependent methyltransferase